LAKVIHFIRVFIDGEKIMKAINPQVAKQLSINFFIANLPLLMLTGMVVASIVGLVFRSPILFWLTLLMTPLAINHVYSKRKIKQFCETNSCDNLSCLGKAVD